MKKILFFTATDFNSKYGGALSSLAHYRAFCKYYGSRMVLALPTEFCHGSFADSISVPARSKTSILFNILRGRFHRFKSFFVEYLKKHTDEYEMVIMNGGFYAGDMVDLFHSYGIKVLVIHHNYEPEYHMDNCSPPTLKGFTSFFVARNERRAYLKADLNVFVTKSDIKLFEEHYGKCNRPPFLLGVLEPVTWEKFPGELCQANKQSQKNIVVTGSLNSVQTVKGVIDFKEKYFSIIRNKYPNWKIILAGRNPANEILQFEKENEGVVRIIPNPENINKVIEMGFIFLCPTNVGGGLKIRLMDGFRNGRPVLVHQVSARGYELFEGQPFYKVYKDEQSFEDGLTQLINFVEHNENFGSQVCSIYRSQFSFEAGCERVKQLAQLI